MAHSYKNRKRERNWDVFCESIFLCKFNSSPAKNERKRMINIAFASWHILLKKRVSDFWHMHLFICDNRIKSEGTNHQHFLSKNVDYLKTKKENKNRRHGFPGKLSHNKWWNRELTLKCKSVVPWFPLLGLTPSGLFMGSIST